MSATAPVTAEMLLRLPDDGTQYELIAGELKPMTPSGWKHGRVVSETRGRMWSFARRFQLGDVFGAETGFLIARDPDTVMAPDVSFIRRERLQGGGPSEAFWPGAPDLAVEVVSPGQSAREMAEKAAAWLAAGAMLVWVVNPQSRTVTVFRSGRGPRVLSDSDQLDGEDVVRGFHSAVAELFQE